MVNLDRKSLPLQVRDRIWDMVQQESYGAGERIPSEQQLATTFGVSRSTIREALKILEDEHLIVCRHGVGRSVVPGASDVLREDITSLRSVTEVAENLGIPLSTKVISLRQELPKDAVRDRLALQPGVAVVILERLRMAHQEPVIYSIDIFPRALVRGELDTAKLNGSLLAVMEGEWNIELTYSKAIISAVNLESGLSEQIGVSDRVPWILLEQTNFDPLNQPVLYSKDYHRADRFQFNVLRRRR
jgi:GntR family transcriptional regulator